MCSPDFPENALSDPASGHRTAPAEEIARRAYFNWLEAGQPADSAEAQWLAAEAELRQLGAAGISAHVPARRRNDFLLPAILENTTAVIYVKDTQGRYLYINRRYEMLFHVDRREVLGKTDRDLFPGEAADAFRSNDLAVLTAHRPVEFEETAPHDDGPHHYISIKFPILDLDGAPFAVCGISTDITERKRSQERLRTEHAVTRVLAESLTLAEAAPRILAAICTCQAWDVGAMWSLDAQLQVLQCVEFWHRPEVSVPHFEATTRRWAFPVGVGLPGEVWKQRRPRWIPDVLADASNFPRAPCAAQDGLQAALGLPIENRSAFLGVLEFFSRRMRAPDEDVLQMLASITRQIGQFVERQEVERQLYERGREFSLARETQQALLPKGPPRLPGFEFAGRSRPTLETCGDYFDFVPMVGGQLGLVLGDAIGKGVGAAMLMVETRALLHALALSSADPGQLLTRMNHRLVGDVGNDRFVTLFLARLDPQGRRLVCSNAGHWPGFVLDGDGRVKAEMHSTSMPLGLDAETGYATGAEIPLAEGDLFFVITDGILESYGPEAGLFGMDRALDFMRAHRDAPPEEMIEALFDEATRFAYGRQTDDMSALVMKVCAA